MSSKFRMEPVSQMFNQRFARNCRWGCWKYSESCSSDQAHPHAPPCPTRARWLSALPLCCSWGPAQACRCAWPTQRMPLEQRTLVVRKDCVSGPPRLKPRETVFGRLPTEGTAQTTTNTNHQSACEKGLFTFCGVSA